MELTYTQCKQIKANGVELADFIQAVNSKPAWITEELSVYDIQAINQGGCASGAYMPAVTYHQALEAMAKNGDDVLDYIEAALGEKPQPDGDDSWAEIAAHYLSCAVELWCSQFADALEGVDWD